MFVYQKIMFDQYYNIKSFCRLKTSEKCLRSSFLFYYNGAQKHEGFVGFENFCSRAKTNGILTSLNYIHFYAQYCWWHQFLCQPRICICKVQKPSINMVVSSVWHIFLCNNIISGISVESQMIVSGLVWVHTVSKVSLQTTQFPPSRWQGWDIHVTLTSLLYRLFLFLLFKLEKNENRYFVKHCALTISLTIKVVLLLKQGP